VSRLLILDEFHLTFTVPRQFAEDRIAAIRHVLNGRRFRSEMRQAAMAVARRRAELRMVRIGLSR
jgi:hypothetical protein